MKEGPLATWFFNLSAQDPMRAHCASVMEQCRLWVDDSIMNADNDFVGTRGSCRLSCQQIKAVGDVAMRYRFLKQDSYTTVEGFPGDEAPTQTLLHGAS